MKLTFARPAGAAALALALVAASTTAHAGNGKSALAKLPQDTAFVFAMNVDRVQRSPLYQDVLRAVQMNQEIAQAIAMVKAQASFDLTKDVHTVVVAAPADFQQNDRRVFLVEGKFDPSKFLKFARAQASSVDAKTYRRVRYYTIDGEQELAFLGKFLAITPKGHMEQVIDVHRGKRASVKANRDFMKLFGEADISQDFWGVFAFPPDMRKQLKSQTAGFDLDLHGASAAVSVQKGLRTDVRLATASLAAATTLASLAKVAVQAGAQYPDVKAIGLGAALSRMKISQSKANVDISFDLTTAELNTVKSLVQGML